MLHDDTCMCIVFLQYDIISHLFRVRHVKIQSHVVHLWTIFSDSIHCTFENSMQI